MGTDGTGCDEALDIILEGRPPELPINKGQCSGHPWMACKFGAVCSLQDLRANRVGHKETIGRLITWTRFMLLSFNVFPLDVQVGPGDEMFRAWNSPPD